MANMRIFMHTIVHNTKQVSEGIITVVTHSPTGKNNTTH